MIAKIKTGVDKEGGGGRDITCHMDGAPIAHRPHCDLCAIPLHEQAYRMENVRYNGYRILTNKPSGACSAPTAGPLPVVSTSVDMIGEALGIDPLQCGFATPADRGRHADQILCGQLRPYGNDREDGKEVEVEREIRELPPYHGIGIGCNSVQTGFPMESGVARRLLLNLTKTAA